MLTRGVDIVTLWKTCEIVSFCIVELDSAQLISATELKLDKVIDQPIAQV